MYNVLKLDKVSYYNIKRKEYVFKNISYDFEAGKMYAIKLDKSIEEVIILSLLSGLETNYDGKIYFLGEDLSTLNLDNYRHKNMGVIFSNYNLLPYLSAVENVIFSMEVSKIYEPNKEEKSMSILKSVGISYNDATKDIKDLSSIQQEYVAIARTLSYNPDLILIEEPNNLDNNVKKDLLNMLSSLAHSQNKCVIIVTRSYLISKYCDETLELKSFKDN